MMMAMKMRMVLQLLPPGVQNGKVADPCAQMLRIGSYLQQCFRGGLKQDVVHDFFILQGQSCQDLRQRKHDVDIRHRQELHRPLFHPFGSRFPLALGTMTVAARVVGVPGVTA